MTFVRWEAENRPVKDGLRLRKLDGSMQGMVLKNRSDLKPKKITNL